MRVPGQVQPSRCRESSDMAYPTVGFFAVADELEVNQALMAVNGIDQAVIAAKADGEAVCPPLKLLALVGVR